MGRDEDPKKVLIVTYYWPPAGGPGVQRFLKMSKYFKEFGWTPVILTVKNGSYPALDRALEEEVPDDIEVIRTRTLEPHLIYNWLQGKKSKMVEETSGNVRTRSGLFSKITNLVRSNFFIPDARVGWKSFATRAAHQRLKKGDIRAVITTGPPHSAHLIGLALRKRYGIKWVADFRDPWSTIFYNRYLERSAAAWKKDRKLENNVLKSSDALVVVSEGMKSEFQERHNLVRTIYNGYDETDFEIASNIKETETFDLVYVGNFKFLQNNEALWQALLKALSKDDEFASDFRLRFVGNVNVAVKENLQNLGLHKWIEYEGYQSHPRAVNYMRMAEVLLFINVDMEDVDKYVTGKLFEYLAAKRPILAISKSGGNTHDILRSCGHDFFDFSQIDQTSNYLLNKYKTWKSSDRILHFDSSHYFKRFSRKNQTSIYASLLDEITAQESPE